jgi:4-hydroxybenzoate polyprenyltransferase
MLQLREAKSLTVAVCMGYVTADTSMFYFCYKDAHCNEYSLRTRSLCLAVLYQFFRETACDIRDIEEDSKHDMKTLPVRLGKNNTLFIMAILGMLLDTLVTKGVLMTWTGLHVNFSLLIGSISRVGVLIGIYSKILQYPKGNNLAWSVMSLLGLMPVLWAQASLSESGRVEQ